MGGFTQKVAQGGGVPSVEVGVIFPDLLEKPFHVYNIVLILFAKEGS